MKQFLYILYLIVTVFALGELAFILFPALSAINPPYNTAIVDESLGWRPKENYSFKGDMYSFDKEPYPISISTNKDGFRGTPNFREGKKRLMIIGDSFTQSVEVSDSKTFYSILGVDLDLDVFSYGMAGYGTLQELMIVEKYIDRVNPDIVILQFCSNDFIDNEVELERRSNYYVGMERPYLNDDFKKVYDNPLSLIEKLIVKTNFTKFCWEKGGRIKEKLGFKRLNSSELKVAEQGDDYEFYSKSKEKTAKLLDRIKESIGSRKLVVFSADHYEPQESDIRDICLQRDILFIPFPRIKMEETRSKTEVYSIDGYHWNEKGHKVIADAIGIVMKSL